MTNGHDRRRFLQIAGTGAAASLAGCTDLGLLGGDPDVDDLLTVAVGPDQETVDELMNEIDSEEIDPAEANQRYQELLGEAVSDFEERAESEDDLSIEESTDEMGLFRVDGAGGSLIDALRDGEVTAIQPGPAYDQILEQQQQRQQQAPPEEPPEEGDLEEPDGEGSGNESSEGSESDETDETDDSTESSDDGQSENESDG